MEDGIRCDGGDCHVLISPGGGGDCLGCNGETDENGDDQDSWSCRPRMVAPVEDGVKLVKAVIDIANPSTCCTS